MNREQVEKYLERIRYTMTGTESGTELIRNLHRNHCLYIPFENLDGCQGKLISLEEEVLFNKMVLHPRGGYCFEMNLMFADVLQGLGYQGYTVQSRVFMVKVGEFGPILHCMNIFEADGKRWLCDVGFGLNGLVEPVELVLDVEQESFGQTFRIIRGDMMDYILQVKEGDNFRHLLAFDDKPVLRKDFEVASFYCNCYPGYLFAEHVVISMPTQTGRISLRDCHMTIYENGAMTEYDIQQDEMEKVLDESFGIRLEERLVLKN